MMKTTRRDLFAEPAVDERFQIILGNFDDAHLALGVLGRIGGVRRIDHDRLAKLASDRAGGRLGWIGRAEHFAHFANRVDALITNRDAFFAAGLVWSFTR